MPMPIFCKPLLRVAILVVLADGVGTSPLPAQDPRAAPDATWDSVAVVVRVVSDGRAIPNATVTTELLAVATSASGRALLRLAPGRYDLAVAAVGFVPDTIPLLLTAAADTAVTVQLERAGVELEEVIVASTRSERRLVDQPLRVEVLGREEIEEKLLMTPGDISMMLNETGGVRVQTTSPSLGGANVRVQGLRGRYTLLLADGLPLYGGQAGGLGLLQVPPMDLGQVEVIKGASSALYGSAALGGVINLISRRPPPPGAAAERELLLNATSLGGADAVGWTAGRVGARWGYTLLTSGHRQGRVDRDDDGWTDVPGYERLVVRPRVFWGEPGTRNVFLTAGLTLEDRDGGTVAGANAPDGAPFLEALRTTRGDVGGSARLPVGEQSLIVVRTSGMTQEHRHRFGEVREPDRHSTYFAEAVLSRGLGRSVAVLGAALQGEHYRSDMFPAFDYDFTVPGVFGHAELVASDRFSAAVSARLDHHSRNGTFLNPRLSLLLSPVPGWSVRVSAGTGFYGPTPFTEETEVTGLSVLRPLEGLRAEVARSASLDVAASLHGIEVITTFFGSLVDHAVQAVGGLAPPGSPASVALVNANGLTRTYGVDAVARVRGASMVGTVSYTFTRATEPAPNEGTRRPVPLTPRHAFGIVAAYERHGRRRVGVELYYIGRQTLDDDPYRTTSRPYVLLGALAEQRVGRIRLFLNLENVTGIRQTTYAPLVRPTRAPDGRWTVDAWAPLDGRVINGGIRVDL